MSNFDIYKDIAERTKGDIYIGVVGPVRTGKSTFIKKFMDLLVLPNIVDDYERERAIDELPQSGTGRTIMTTEPKFIPSKAVNIEVEENINFNVRLVDCVGYLIDGATGHTEDELPRMINTPWSSDRLPFEQAAEIGTRKVIEEHSTIGIVMTSDGTVTEFEREEYIDAETRVIDELKGLNKPFVIVLNTTKPFADETLALVNEMQEMYSKPVIPINCSQMKHDDIHKIISNVLLEFPLRKVTFNFPKWIEILENDHWLKGEIINTIFNNMENINKLVDIKPTINTFGDESIIKKANIENFDLGKGMANVDIATYEHLFFDILSETTEMDIKNEYELISNIKLLSQAKREYDKVRNALDEVEHKGYGIVTPVLEEMKLSKPELVKHGARYGVKITAKAPSIHFVKADIETEVAPIVGTEEQSIDLINYINEEMDKNDGQIWELNMFGKTMHELVREGLQTKLYRMPDDAQVKLQESLQRIINDGDGGLICILL